MAELVVRLDRVSFERGNRKILQDIQWEIERGQHWTVVGGNGSGKSTLLNLISGYLWASRGTVEVLGNRLGSCDLRELRKSIGWVGVGMSDWFGRHHPRDRALDVAVSGAFASIGIYHSVSDALWADAQHLLDQFGVAHLAQEPFFILSQGEKQRVILARAWMARPKLLILDEPTTGLDLVAREQLLVTVGWMGSVKDGPTILYVTHHVEEVLPIFSHALLLREGRMVGAGPTDAMLTSLRLSQTFGMGVEVTWRRERPWVTLDSRL